MRVGRLPVQASRALICVTDDSRAVDVSFLHTQSPASLPSYVPLPASLLLPCLPASLPPSPPAGSLQAQLTTDSVATVNNLLHMTVMRIRQAMADKMVGIAAHRPQVIA